MIVNVESSRLDVLWSSVSTEEQVPATEHDNDGTGRLHFILVIPLANTGR